MRPRICKIRADDGVGWPGVLDDPVDRCVLFFFFLREDRWVLHTTTLSLALEGIVFCDG